MLYNFSMKKLLFGLGTVAAVITPVVAAVSCGANEASEKNEKEMSIKFSCYWNGRNHLAEVLNLSSLFTDSQRIETPKESDDLNYKIKYTLHKNDDNPSKVFFTMIPSSVVIEGLGSYLTKLESSILLANKISDGYNHTDFDYKTYNKRLEFIESQIVLTTDDKNEITKWVENNVTFGTPVNLSNQDGKNINEVIKKIAKDWVEKHPLI